MLEPGVLKLMREIYLEALREGTHPVSFSCGRFLYLVARMLADSRPVKAVEIGTGFGFSTLWMALGLAHSRHKGILYTMEARAEKARKAEENLARADLSSYARVLVGDALSVLPSLSGPFDLAFLDGRKDQYARYLALLSPKMPEGSILMAHNVIGPSPRDVADFLAEVMETGDWLTLILPLDPAGLSISMRLRPVGREARHEVREGQ